MDGQPRLGPLIGAPDPELLGRAGLPLKKGDGGGYAFLLPDMRGGRFVPLSEKGQGAAPGRQSAREAALGVLAEREHHARQLPGGRQSVVEVEPAWQQAVDGTAQAKGRLQPSLPQLLGDARYEPSAFSQAEGLDGVGCLQGETLGEFPLEEGFPSLCARRKGDHIPKQDGGSPEIIHDPGRGPLRQACQEGAEALIAGESFHGQGFATRKDPVGFQPDHRSGSGLET